MARNITLDLIRATVAPGQREAATRLGVPQSVQREYETQQARRELHVAVDGRVTAVLESREAKVSNTATDKQTDFADSLIDQLRGLDRVEFADACETRMTELIKAGEWTKAAASAAIETILRHVKNAKISAAKKPRHDLADVPAGRYAIDPAGESVNDVVFYHVSYSRNGRVFVQQRVSDTLTDVDWKFIPSILRRIAVAGTKAAMIRFGQELGVCGHCGRTLTSEWRKKGIGPVCSTSW